MRLTIALLGLLISSAVILGQSSVPAGTILAASDALMQLPGTETWLAAAPGIELRAGYKLRAATGTLRFSFCRDAEQTLLPGHELVLPSCDASARGVVAAREPEPGAGGKTFALLIGISEY